MKTKFFFIAASLALASIIAAVFPDSTRNCTFELSKASESITPDEELSLIYMREEEKLALDFYTFMQSKYDHKVFKNISQAETRHGGFVKELLDRYSVPDPSSSKSEGEFNDPNLAALYSSLITKGSLSLNEALKCGAEIEELDISDLDKRLELTTSRDIKETFLVLKEGSTRHLQAFVRNIEAAGEKYTPVYLSQNQFDEIIKSEVTKKYRCGNCPNGINGKGFNQDGSGDKCRRLNK